MIRNVINWLGTIPLFIFLVTLFTMVFLMGATLTYLISSNFAPIWLSSILAFFGGLVFFGLFLNIPIPRRKKDPMIDLNNNDLIASGAWCKVYHKAGDKAKVVKQLYPCGWGHNDYTKHQAFVIGKEKICGKWNPLVLWFLHNYMLLYQLIGLKRRIRIERDIEGLPTTYYVNNGQLRYEQEYVDFPLTVETCPSDIREQFKQLNEDLERQGMYIDDVHAGNVRITKNGKIKIVDGELYSGGEEWVKSKVVVLFNGAMVSNMESVLGCERIIAWVDHRLSVDEVVCAWEIKNVESVVHRKCS